MEKNCEKNGLIGLIDTRETSTGRPRKNELSKSEIIEKIGSSKLIIRGAGRSVKKARKDRRMLLNKGKNIKASEKFQLIYETITKKL